jgi:hypothetical protein
MLSVRISKHPDGRQLNYWRLHNEFFPCPGSRVDVD